MAGKEGKILIAKFSGENARSKEEKKILTPFAVMGEVIANQCQLKLTENQEANLIAERAIAKVQEANKMSELFRVICEIPEKPSGNPLRYKREIENEWKFLVESKEVSSAGQIGQLSDLRFKTQMGIRTYQEKSDENFEK